MQIGAGGFQFVGSFEVSILLVSQFAFAQHTLPLAFSLHSSAPSSALHLHKCAIPALKHFTASSAHPNPVCALLALGTFRRPPLIMARPNMPCQPSNTFWRSPLAKMRRLLPPIPLFAQWCPPSPIQCPSTMTLCEMTRQLKLRLTLFEQGNLHTDSAGIPKS
jgi:hypothetical protein